MKKRIIWIPIVIILIFLLVATGLTFQDEPEGFRGLKWGDPPLEGMKLFNEQPLLNAYMIPNEHLFLGNVTLYLIAYQFFIQSEEEVFMAVGLYFKGEENHDRMKRICQEKFGEETEKDYQSIAWFSLESMVMLKYDTIEEEGYLVMGSMPLSLERTAALKKLEAKKAEKDW